MIVRELFAKLGLNVDAQSFAKGQAAIEVAKFGLGKLVDFAKEAVEKVKEVAEAGHGFELLAQKTGTSTEEIQNLSRAAGMAGVGTDSLAQSLKILSKQMFAAKNGNEEAQKSFHRMGIKVRGADGHLRSTSDVLMDLADHFSTMPDGAEKTAKALQVLGRGGAELIPLLNKGRDGIAELGKGTNLTEEQIKASAELVKTQKQLAAVSTGLWRQAIGPLIPAITDLLKRYLAWRKANAAIMAQRIRQWVGYVITGVKALANLFSFLVKNAKLVEIVVGVALVMAFSRLSDKAVIAAGRTAAAWLLAAAPFILLAALVAGLFLLFDDIRVYNAGGKSAYGRFKKEIDAWLKPNANDPWWLAAIKDFVRLLQQAVELMNEFDTATKRFAPQNVDKGAAQNKGQLQSRADVFTQEAARRRAAAGLPLTDEMKRALERANITPEAFAGKYAPAGPAFSAAPPGGGVSSVVISSAPQITINPPAGSSTDDIRGMVREELQDHEERLNEDAMQSVSR